MKSVMGRECSAVHVYSELKVFHWHQKLDDMAAGRLSAPVHVRLKPTNRCNHHCAYCCYRSQNLHLSELMDERDEIPRAKMAEIVSDLAQMGVRAVTLSGGGEPLCYPHIIETIQGLCGAGIKLAALSNGARLAGDVAQFLALHATWVRVSMDAADRDLYARTRRVDPGEFDKVCRNLNAFARIAGRRCVLGVNLIVGRENSKDVLAFLKIARELGADNVKVSNAVISIHPREMSEYMMPFYESVKAQIGEAQSMLCSDSFAIVDKFHLPESDQEGFSQEYGRCPSIQCLTIIAADQNVYTCHDKAYTRGGLLGSIRERSFADLWFSEETKQKLSTLNPRDQCQHHCSARGKNMMLLDYLDADEEHLEFV